MVETPTHFGTIVLPDRLAVALGQTMSALAAAGDHWTGSQRLAIARLARMGFGARHRPPWTRSDVAASAGASELSPVVTDIVTTLAADAARIDGAWARAAVDRLGAGPYVEVVAIVATMAIVDAFAESIGTEPAPLPSEPTPGEPVAPDAGSRGYEVDDIGAYVPMRVPWTDANVGRALTLSPSGNQLYRALAVACYHDGQFYDLAWDRALARPQAEVLATAVSAANECFY